MTEIEIRKQLIRSFKTLALIWAVAFVFVGLGWVLNSNFFYFVSWLFGVLGFFEVLRYFYSSTRSDIGWIKGILKGNKKSDPENKDRQG